MENTFMYLTTVIILAGYIIGLGAVTVIDIHGFLGRKSSYWTEATVRTHKVTKPLIWLGLFFVLVGSIAYFSVTPAGILTYLFFLIIALLLINGLFLTFYVSPYLLREESLGKADKLLPIALQIKITVSFVISFIGWWGSFLLLVYLLHMN